jgi:hypothetical protein
MFWKNGRSKNFVNFTSCWHQPVCVDYATAIHVTCDAAAAQHLPPVSKSPHHTFVPLASDPVVAP